MAEKNNNKKHALLLAVLLASALSAPVAGKAGEFRLLPAAKVLADQNAAGLTADKPAVATVGLVPFEQSAAALRLTGEDDVSMLSFYVSPAQLAAGGQIQLAYQNAVSVLPDTASLNVELNGKDIGAFSIRSPNGFKVEKLAIPANQLKAGRNALRLAVSQHHRVDCSLDATYELWTQLDAAQSGFLGTLPAAFATIDDLMAIGRNKDGFTEIHLIAPAGGSAAIVNDSAAVIQALALFLDRDDIVVTVGEQPGTGAGIDLYVGSGTQLNQTPQARQILAAAPAGLSVRPGEVAGRATVLMVGTGRSELTTGLLTAVRGPMQAGLNSGVLAKTWGTLAAEASTRYSLADIGYDSKPFAGRLSRTHFNLDMPADFYPAEYDTMNFYLKAATAPGIAAGSQLLVRVNDRVVTSFPFRNTDGEQFNDKRIELPLRAFHPGVNRVELLAEVPVPADAACQPGERADNKPRFMMLADSALQVPALARIGRLPDLGAFAGAAYPFRDGSAFDVFVEQPDLRSAGVALTTVARLGLAARKPLNAEIKFSAPSETSTRNALVISTGEAVATLKAPGNADSLLTGFEAAPAETTDPVTTAALDTATTASKIDSSDSQQLLDVFKQSTAVESDNRSWASQAQGMLAATASKFRHWLNYEDPAASSLSANEAGSLVSVSQMQAPSGEGTWTIIKSDTPQNLALGMNRLADPAIWAKLEGGSASVRATTLELVTRPAAGRYITEITDSSFGNFRRLAASWFSDNFQVYVVLLIVLLGGFGAWVGLVVPRKGVRTDQ